jgi:hypothetical protein
MRKGLVLVFAAVACSAGADDTTTTATIDETTTTESTTTTTVSTTTTTVTTTTAVDEATVDLEIDVTGGVVTPDLGRVNVPLGGLVRIKVTSDAADEVHVHGYDLFAEVGAGEDITLEFVADVPGIFEVEMEHARLALVELQVGG